MEFFSSYISPCDETEDVVEGISLREFSRRPYRYKKKPFRPELEDIHEEEESAALKSSSEAESDDDIVVFKAGRDDTIDLEELLEPTLRSSLLGIDFWWELSTQNWTAGVMKILTTTEHFVIIHKRFNRCSWFQLRGHRNSGWVLQVDNGSDHGWWRHWPCHHQQLCPGARLPTTLKTLDCGRLCFLHVTRSLKQLCHNGFERSC